MKPNSKVYHFFYFFFLLISILSLTLLSVSSLIFTSYFDKVTYEQKMYTYIGNIPFALLFLALFLVLAWLLAKWVMKSPEKRCKILLIITCCYAFLLSFAWTVFAKTLPSSDSASVWQLAVSFAQGNYGAILPRDSYLACYPHQLGLIGFYELVFRVIPLYDFRVLQCLNIPLIILFIVSCYKLTRILFSEHIVSVYYLFLIFLCLPLYLYAPNVYGDIPAMAFISFSVWMLFAYFQNNKWYCVLLSGLALILAVVVRENSLIFVIAYGIAWLFRLIKHRKFIQLLPLVLILFFAFTTTPGIRIFYENLAHSTVGEGIPSSAHIAMGMQEGPIAPGWYNGYNFNTFIENDYDSAITNEMSVASIHDSIGKFSKDPLYATAFFWTKFVTQWTEPTYHFLLACYASYGDRLPIINSMFSGRGETFLIAFSDYYQFTLLFGALLFLIFTAKSNFASRYGNIEQLLFYIALFGGLVFHTIWEGKARYIMPYCLFLLPFAAAGLQLIATKVVFLFPRNKRKEHHQAK